jgi:hypothetical protein
MSYTAFANPYQTLVVLFEGVHIPIVGWSSSGYPITPLNLSGWPDVLDTKTNCIYRYKDGVGSIEKYEESINGR